MNVKCKNKPGYYTPMAALPVESQPQQSQFQVLFFSRFHLAEFLKKGKRTYCFFCKRKIEHKSKPG